MLGALMALVFLAYGNALHAPLLLDNEGIILKDARIQSLSGVQLHRILDGQYWEVAPTGLYRPLVTLSYLFDYSILGNGADPAGYHWINILLHAVNVALVYLIGLAIFEQIPYAFFLAALWGLHPMQTEAVTNVVGRADLLAAFAVLAAVLCQRQALRNAGRRRAAWIAGIAMVVTAGIFSKESAVVAVAVLVAWDFCFERQASWRSRSPGYLAASVPCLVYLAVRAHVLANSPLLGTGFTDNPLLAAGFWTSRLTAIKVIVRYVALWLWPASLSYDYSYNQVPLSNWGDWQTLLALAGCLAAAVGAIRSAGRKRIVLFAAAFFFITLSPVSNLIILIGTIMAERFLYLPSVALTIVVIYGLTAASRRFPQAVRAAVVLILVAALVRTWARNADYTDPQVFWRSGVEAAPGSYKTHLNVSNNSPFLTSSDWDRALREIRSALSILDPLPDDRNAPIAYRNAGVLYRNIGDRLAAGQPAGSLAAGTTPESWYRQSLAVLLRSERIELAWNRQYRDANPKWRDRGITTIPAELYLDLGQTYLRLSDSQHALEAFEKGRRLGSDPDLLEALATVYRTFGRTHDAALAAVEALAVDPSRSQLNGRLIELYQQLDPGGCSVTREGGSLGLNVTCPFVHADICAASRNVEQNYRRRGQDYEAGAIHRVAAEQLGCR